MAKKKSLEHEYLNLKNDLLGSARTMWNSNDFEKQLASLIIYASFAEYLAEHLLLSVKYAVENASYSQYGGILFLNTEEKKTSKPLTMYDYINRLDNYEFPDKSNIVLLLKETAKARNKLFHDFARLAPDDADKLGQYVNSIQSGTEELINRINTVEATIKTLTGYQVDFAMESTKNET